MPLSFLAFKSIIFIIIPNECGPAMATVGLAFQGLLSRNLDRLAFQPLLALFLIVVNTPIWAVGKVRSAFLTDHI